MDKKYIVSVEYRKFEFDCPKEALMFALQAFEHVKKDEEPDVEIKIVRVKDAHEN